MPRQSGRGLVSRDPQRTNSERRTMSDKPHISYVDPNTVSDPAMLAEFERCAREGTPRPESQAVRAHVPAVFWSFANSWRDVFKPVSYTHLRAHETGRNLVCRLLLEKKK